MHQSKLIEALRALPTKQHRRLRDFVHSPFFNKNKEATAFFEAIQQYGPRYKRKNILKEKIYAEAFPGEKYDEKKLGYLMSDVLKMLEGSLMHTMFEDQPVQGAFYLLASYNELELDKHFNKTLLDARKLQNQHPYRTAEYFYNEFLLESVSNAFFDKKGKHVIDESLQKAIDNLDLYYLTEKLHYSCEIFNRKNVVAAEYELRLLDEILVYVKNRKFEGAPAIEIYYQILMTLTESENEKHFSKLKSLLKKYAKKLPVRTARDMYAYAQNYCIKRINRGDPDYLEELFILYKTTLKDKIIFIGKYLSPWSYKNIVGVGLRLEEYAWVEQFINDYKEHLSPDVRENAYVYNLASMHFNQRNFNNALELLRNVEFTDIFYNLDSKAMMLRIYYELEEIDALMSMLESFRIYLKRNKLISDYQRTIYLNLILFVKEIVRIPPGDHDKALEVRERIKDTRQVAYLQWLTEKVNKLSGVTEKSGSDG